MLKFLLIVAIVVYIVYKIASFFYRAGIASQHFRNLNNQQRSNGRSKQKDKFKGGEYIDYEEVK